MDELQFMGYLVSAIITLAIIMKFIQPINDLRVVIQKLNDTIETLKNDNATQNKRIEKHGEQIENLEKKVDKMQTKMEMYHKD